MHIHLIGGSNTGIWDGWAHHFGVIVWRETVAVARIARAFGSAVSMRLRRL